jgi:hypothetical protein
MFHKTASFFYADANNRRLNALACAGGFYARGKGPAAAKNVSRLHRRISDARPLSDLFRRNTTFYCK